MAQEISGITRIEPLPELCEKVDHGTGHIMARGRFLNFIGPDHNGGQRPLFSVFLIDLGKAAMAELHWGLEDGVPAIGAFLAALAFGFPAVADSLYLLCKRIVSPDDGQADAGPGAEFDNSEIKERKQRLRDLYKRGASRTESERVLNLSASTVKRLSRDMGLDWRIKTAKR
jgi:hypothetical protein